MNSIKFQAHLGGLRKLEGGDLKVVLAVSKQEAGKALVIPEETNLEIEITPKESLKE